MNNEYIYKPVIAILFYLIGYSSGFDAGYTQAINEVTSILTLGLL